MLISFKNVSISFEQEKIIENLSFNIKKGDKLAITGSSGKGKSTILNVLLGFIPDYTGKIHVFNTLLSEDTIKYIRQKTAWLPQEITFDFETVNDLLLSPFQFSINKNQKPKNTEIDFILNEFDLSKKLLKKKINEISGGQKQRIALASVMLMKKPLIILDEPTSALDENLKEKICNYILSDKETTIISSTHDKYWISESSKILKL